ncbi:MAG: metallopeptidase family protein [Planctomycetota bacterium]
MTPGDRTVFDRCFEEVFRALPPAIRSMIERDLAVIVEDEPTADMLADVGMAGEPAESLLGLHTGVPLTEQSVEDHGVSPPIVHLFRAGLLAEASSADGTIDGERLREQIRITLLHEIGHHYGLDEDDLDALGYA